MNNNFEVNTTIKEVMAVDGHITVDIVIMALDYYKAYFKERGHDKCVEDYYSRFITALTDIYITGYISGVRAERKKRQRKRQL